MTNTLNLNAEALEGHFGKYLVFADESGDHNLIAHDKKYPIFVLAFCIIQKDHYCDVVLSEFNKLKLKYFQDETTVFHGEDIRKKKNDFRILNNLKINALFIEDLTELIRDKIQYSIIATAIRKDHLQHQYAYPENPYYLATQFCLERLMLFLQEKDDFNFTTVVFEARGKEEDKNLELAFLKESSNPKYNSKLSIKIISKKANTVGLQLADLVSKPIGRHILNPEQTNRAFDAIKGHLRSDANGRFIGRGLKIFP
jgi:hypothetical protein